MRDDRVSGQERRSSGSSRIVSRRIARSGSYGWAGSFRAAGAAAIGAGLLWTASPALAEKGGPCHSIKQQVSEIKVTLYKSRTLCFSGPFSTAVIGAPEIADVLPITESMLYVQGKKVGATNISVFDQQRRLVSVIDLEVAPDKARCKTRSRPRPAAGISMSPARTARLFLAARRLTPSRPLARSKSRKDCRRTRRSSTQ